MRQLPAFVRCVAGVAIALFTAATGVHAATVAGDLSSVDALLRALDGSAASFPTRHDYFRNVSTATNPGAQATLVGALRTAIVALTTQYGTADQTRWLTPKITVEFTETSASSQLYGPTTIERENRGAMNELLELLPTLQARIVVPPGNSAYIPPTLMPEPQHLRDQLALYESFQYHALPFSPAELEGPTTTQTITVP